MLVSSILLEERRKSEALSFEDRDGRRGMHRLADSFPSSTVRASRSGTGDTLPIRRDDERSQTPQVPRRPRLAIYEDQSVELGGVQYQKQCNDLQSSLNDLPGCRSLARQASMRPETFQVR